MALKLDFYGQLGKPDRELAGFVASHIKDVMTDRFVVYPVNAPGDPYYLLEPWWPVYDRTMHLLSRMMMWTSVGAIVLPVMAACAAAVID